MDKKETYPDQSRPDEKFIYKNEYLVFILKCAIIVYVSNCSTVNEDIDFSRTKEY